MRTASPEEGGKIRSPRRLGKEKLDRIRYIMQGEGAGAQEIVGEGSTRHPDGMQSPNELGQIKRVIRPHVPKLTRSVSAGDLQTAGAKNSPANSGESTPVSSPKVASVVMGKNYTDARNQLALRNMRSSQHWPGHGQVPQRSSSAEDLTTSATGERRKSGNPIAAFQRTRSMEVRNF